jgi:hypothetical protein
MFDYVVGVEEIKVEAVIEVLIWVRTRTMKGYSHSRLS